MPQLCLSFYLNTPGKVENRAPRDVSAVQLKDITTDIFILRKCQIMHDFINTSSAEVYM